MITLTEYEEAIKERNKLLSILNNELTQEQNEDIQYYWKVQKDYERQECFRKPKNVVDFKKLEKIKEKRELEPYNYSNKNWINLKSGVFNMIPKSMKNPTSLLWCLLQWKTWKDTNGNIRNGIGKYWYEKGYIVSTRSQEQLAVELGVSEWTIKRWIKELYLDGIIDIKKHGLLNVYVLGTVKQDKNGHDIEKYWYSGELTRTNRRGKK